MNGQNLLDPAPPVNVASDTLVPPELERPLPAWLVPTMLGALFVISGLIVLTGWLIMMPATPSGGGSQTPAIALYHPRADAGEPLGTSLPRVVEESPSMGDVPFESTESPHSTVRLKRRLPSHQMVSDETIAPPPLDLATESPTPPKAAMALQRGLRWQTDSHGAIAQRLIMPIEIATVDDPEIPHTIRRLRLTAPPASLKLAVTPVHHDDLGSILTRMGPGYQYTQLQNDDLYSSDALKKHDVVFLTCADQYARDFRAAKPLREFVAQGGTLYASDLRGDLLQAAFPEFRAMAPILHGVPQSIEARIVDPGLRSHIGRRVIPLNFEAPDWRPAPFDPNRTTVCLTGIYRNNLGQTMSVPLLVKFRYQKGTVIFTSFHHTKNDSGTVRKLLDYLVFAAVNARNEARIKDVMQRSQFSPNEMRATILNTGEPFEAVHHHAAGGLQIALGFEATGAKLKLTLRSPTGQIIEHTDAGLYLIEIPKAAPGAWRYTVTPLEMPYANFPVTVAIGAAKS